MLGNATLNAAGAKRALGFSAVAIGMAVGFNAPTQAQDFDYKGKTIRMIIGSGTGGGYDAYGRLLAAHITRHMAAKPTIIVQNMPGAGALVLANHLANVAAGDPTVIGGINPAVSTYPIYKPESAKYDARKFGWIGCLQADTFVAIAWHDSPIKTFKDVFEKEFVVGGSGGASTDYPPAINALLGTKYKMVAGYKGTNQSMLAMERGEVAGVGGTTWSSLKAQSRSLLDGNKIRVIVQYTKTRNKELPNVPSIYDFAKSEADRQFMDAMFAYQAVGRAYITPPGVPDGALKTFRAAFDATVKDSAFTEDAEKRGIEIDPKSGEEIEPIVASIAATPPDVVARVLAVKAQSAK